MDTFGIPQSLKYKVSSLESVQDFLCELGQGNLIGAGREGSRFFYNLSIFEIEKCFIPLFGSLGLQFLLAKKFEKF